MIYLVESIRNYLYMVEARLGGVATIGVFRRKPLPARFGGAVEVS